MRKSRNTGNKLKIDKCVFVWGDSFEGHQTCSSAGRKDLSFTREEICKLPTATASLKFNLIPGCYKPLNGSFLRHVKVCSGDILMLVSLSTATTRVAYVNGKKGRKGCHRKEKRGNWKHAVILRCLKKGETKCGAWQVWFKTVVRTYFKNLKSWNSTLVVSFQMPQVFFL